MGDMSDKARWRWKSAIDTPRFKADAEAPLFPKGRVLGQQDAAMPLKLCWVIDQEIAQCDEYMHVIQIVKAVCPPGICTRWLRRCASRWQKSMKLRHFNAHFDVVADGEERPAKVTVANLRVAVMYDGWRRAVAECITVGRYARRPGCSCAVYWLMSHSACL